MVLNRLLKLGQSLWLAVFQNNGTWKLLWLVVSCTACSEGEYKNSINWWNLLHPIHWLQVIMSLRASHKVRKYRLFYFHTDRTICIVSLNKIEKVVSRDSGSKGSRVMLKYGNLTLEAAIVDLLLICCPSC